jgi:hypothetical protein
LPDARVSLTSDRLAVISRHAFSPQLQAQRPDSQYFPEEEEEISQINARLLLAFRRPFMYCAPRYHVARMILTIKIHHKIIVKRIISRISQDIARNVQGYRIALNRDILNQHFTSSSRNKWEIIMFFNNIKNDARI